MLAGVENLTRGLSVREGMIVHVHAHMIRYGWMVDEYGSGVSGSYEFW